MLEHLDPTMIGIAFLVWPVTKSLVVLGAAATSMWSRDEGRRKAAEHILRALVGDAGDRLNDAASDVDGAAGDQEDVE